jgi:uncharacterized protein YqgC (DUF456 family)
VVAISVLAFLAWTLDQVAVVLGARKAGASRLAILGAALDTLAALFLRLVWVLFMRLVGAAAGGYLARRDRQRAVHFGMATWLGVLAGLFAEVVIALMMIGIFVAALLI